MLKICIASQEFPPHTNWGGIGVYNHNQAQRFVADGHSVVVISRAHPGAPSRDSIDGIQVLRVGVPISRKRWTGRTVDRILHARAVAEAVRRLERERCPFDVIETTEASLEGEVLLRDIDARRRFVIQCNGSNEFGEIVPGLLRPLHALDWNWSFRREQVVLCRTGTVVATSEATRSVLVRQGVDPAKIHLIHQGIDTERFRPPAVAPPSPILQVGFVGRLERRKGIDVIWRVAEAFRNEERIHFHLKGSLHPAARRDTAQRLRELAGKVTYHPPSDVAKMPDFYRTLHVLLQPSRFENFGLTYVEAMATELVVFAGVRGGGSEIIEPGRNGYLVDPDESPEGVIGQLREMICNWDSQQELRRAARHTVIERFSVERFARRKLELYEAVSTRARETEEKRTS